MGEPDEVLVIHDVCGFSRLDESNGSKRRIGFDLCARLERPRQNLSARASSAVQVECPHKRIAVRGANETTSFQHRAHALR